MTQYNRNIWKIVIIALLVLLLSLSLRLDLNNIYPKGADTYDLSMLSKNIQQNGYVVWNIDFLTSIGMTSISYPPGGIIFLSELSTLTGLNTTDSILIWNFFLIIITGLFLYIISKEIFNDNLSSLITVLVYLNARFFIYYSTFFTSRNILHIFFLTILFLLLKRLNIKQILLVCFLILMSYFTHRATVLIGIFVIAFILSNSLTKYYKNNLLHNTIILFSGMGIFFVSAYFFGHTNIGSETTRIPFTVGINYIDNLLSIIFSISMHFGILILLIPLGYLTLLSKKNKNNKDLFIIMSITLAFGFAIETIYFFYIFLPIMAIIVGYFINYILINDNKAFATNNFLKKNNKLVKYSAIAIVIIALIIPTYITITDYNSDTLVVRKQTVELSMFLESNNIQKSIICNNHFVYCSQIASFENNITALTSSSGRIMITKTDITKKEVVLWRLRGSILYTDKILRTSIFSDTYTNAIINWNTPKPFMDKLIKFTNLGYIIDSNNPDSISNKIKLENKFPYTDNIYNNGLQQVKVIQ
jgi:hypothetical protein